MLVYLIDKEKKIYYNKLLFIKYNSIKFDFILIEENSQYKFNF